MTTRFGVLAPADVHADGYIHACERSEAIEFVGIADDDAGWGDDAADSHDTLLYSTDDLLSRVDAVAIFSTYKTRQRWIEAAAAAGVDVLCELPLATTVSDARSFVGTCRNAGVTLGMITPLRCGEPMRRAKDLVEGGEIGNLGSIVARNRCAFRNRDVEGWSTDPEHADGGSVVHHSEHTVDAARWLTGAEFEKVYAELGYQRGLDVDDVNVISAELTDGTAFVTDTSWTTPDSDEFWGESDLDLIGADATMSVADYDEAFHVIRDGEDGDDGGRDDAETGIQRHHFGASSTEALLYDFVDAIETGREPVATGIDGLRQVEVIEAVYASAEQNKPISVERALVD